MIPIHETRFLFINFVYYYLNEIFHGGKDFCVQPMK